MKKAEFPNDWGIYHITWATHNSRISERMINLCIMLGKPVILNNSEEVEVTRYILQIVKEDQLLVSSYNICRDHVHMLLFCAENKLTNIIQKLKSVSAKKFNIAHGYTRSLEHQKTHSPRNKGACSLVPGRECRGATQRHLWTQKYNCAVIKSDEHLENTIAYIHYNREKHGLPSSEELQSLINKMITPIDQELTRSHGPLHPQLN